MSGSDAVDGTKLSDKGPILSIANLDHNKAKSAFSADS